MQQISLSQAHETFSIKPKRTRKQRFLDSMNAVVPWSMIEQLITPHYSQPSAKGGRPPARLSVMLRIFFLQQWFGLSDPAVEEALHDMPTYRHFVGLDAGIDTMPDETTILRFRHLLEEHKLQQQIFDLVRHLLQAQGLMLQSGTTVDATLIAAPSSTKNKKGQRDPDMHSSRKGLQWHFGMKAHIGTDTDSGLVHSLVGTSGHVHDVTQVHKLLHGQEQGILGDAGYAGADKRADVHTPAAWFIAMRPGKHKALNKQDPVEGAIDRFEKAKAKARAKVEHAFGVLKCQFGYRKVRYKGLEKNTAQLHTLFALVNLYLARKPLQGLQA
jgi:IS5 family transposase